MAGFRDVLELADGGSVDMMMFVIERDGWQLGDTFQRERPAAPGPSRWPS
jgi:hypothetical protein